MGSELLIGVVSFAIGVTLMVVASSQKSASLPAFSYGA